jgi:hypothetical protein
MQFLAKSLKVVRNNIVLIVLLILTIVVITTACCMKERFTDFSGVWKNPGNYPTIYTDDLIQPFINKADFNKYYLPSDVTISPVSSDIPQLDLNFGKVKVPVDIGNGLIVEADVEIPPQKVEMPGERIVLPKTKKTGDVVPANVVQIPAQNGKIPVKINGTDESVIVPVSIPSQTVVILEQPAIEKNIVEPFKLY